MSTMTPAQTKAGANRVRDWADPRVFGPDQVIVIRGWADQLFTHGPDAQLSPTWPSRLRSTQITREETARRLFREGGAT